jgi:hypothetical protein
MTKGLQESGVREIRTLRLTWRELETWPRWNCDPTAQSKESRWKPSTYRARASSRPYLRGAVGKVPNGNSLAAYSTVMHGSGAEPGW